MNTDTISCAFCMFDLRTHQVHCEKHRTDNEKATMLARGKVIENAAMVGDSLRLVFADGSMLTFSDCAQSCCEKRYMTCGDELQEFTGEQFVRFDVLEALNSGDGYDVHETQFLHIRLASGSVIACETHNEHNGYYGGFDVRAEYAQEGPVAQ